MDDIEVSLTKWKQLRKEVDSINDDSKNTNERLNSELSKLEEKMQFIEDKINKTTKDIFTEYVKKAQAYDQSIKSEMEHARTTRAHIDEASSNLDALLNSVRNELEKEIKGNVSSEIDNLKIRSSELEKAMLAKTTKLIKDFYTAAQSNMTDFETNQENKTFEFLKRQETVLKNINMQMDTYSRTSLTFNDKLEKVSKSFLQDIGAIKDDLSTAKADLTEIRANFDRKIEENAKDIQEEILSKTFKQAQSLQNVLENKHNARILFLEEELAQLKSRSLFKRITGSK